MYEPLPGEKNADAETVWAAAAEALRLALRDPAAVRSPAAHVATRALARAHTADESAVALGLLAALAYARSELLPDLVGELAKRLEGAAGESARERAGPAPADAAEAFAHLAHTPLARLALRALLAAAESGVLFAQLGAEGVELLGESVNVHPELWTLDAALRALPADASLHEQYMGRVIEPLLLRERATLTVEALAGLERTCAGSRRFGWTLATLVGRADLPAGVRAFADARCRAGFPHRAAARPLLRPGFQLTILVNVRFGLGDEVIRVVPLLQSLLDANPSARATILTPRPFLYDHPRVNAVAITDPAAEELLRRTTDGLFVLHEPQASHVVWRPDLDAASQECIEKPWLLLRGDVSRGFFLFQRVRLGKTELAFRLALDRSPLPSVYDPTRRLLLELGLPVRLGEESAATGNVLTALASDDAPRVWRALVPVGRKAALVGPFGGHHRLKGYLGEQAAEVAAGLTSLVREGYRVVLLPNGRPWSDPDTQERILSAVEPSARHEVVVAPDPATAGAPWTELLRERPELPWADRVMRIHKYLVGLADLVVAVEGWAGHVAYQLGRPFRLLLRTDSDTGRWHPPFRGPRQVLATDLARQGPPFGADALDGRVIAPSLPRRRMLLSALGALRALGGPGDLELLRAAAASPDGPIRAEAMRSMADVGRRTGQEATVAPELLRHLQDSRARVRGAAAEALLALGTDLAAELGPRFEAQLRAYAAVGRQQWQAVILLGTAALPALARAASDESELHRHEAQWAIRAVLGPLAGPMLAKLNRA